MTNYNVLLIIIATVVTGIAIYLLYAIIMYKGTKKEAELQLTTKNVLEQVKILYDKGEYALVELLAANYLDRVPSHYEVRQYLAKAYFKCQKYNNAIKQCSIILKAKRKDFETKKLLADCYVEKQVIGRAIREYEELFELKNNDHDVLKTLANLYKFAEQNSESIAVYNMLLGVTDNKDELAEIYGILASLNEEVYDYPAAFEAYKNRLAIYPNDIDANKKIAELYIRIGNKHKAIETLQYVLSISQDAKIVLWTYETLVNLYVELEDYEKAIDNSEKMLEIQGADKFKINDNIAQFNVKLANFDKGISILEELVMMSQNAYDVTVQLADAYRQCKEYQKALDSYLVLLDKANQKEAKNIRLLICDLYVSWAIDSRESNLEASYKYLEQAIQYNPLNAEIYYNIGLNKIKQNLQNEAIENIRKSIEYDKHKDHYVEHLLTIAEVYQEQGSFFEEKKAVTDLLNVDATNSKALYMNGLMYLNQHDIKNAETYFQKALEADPEMTIAKYNLALLLENNDKQRSKELYMEILEQTPDFEEAKTALNNLSIN